MAEKIYCGNGKKVNTKFGEMMKVSFSQDDINKMVRWMKDNDSKWINLDILEKRSPEQGKPTHYCVVDEWKPEKKSESGLPPSEKADEGDDDALPF